MIPLLLGNFPGIPWLFTIPREFPMKSPMITLLFPIPGEFIDDSVVIPHSRGIPQELSREFPKVNPFSVKIFPGKYPVINLGGCSRTILGGIETGNMQLSHKLIVLFLCISHDSYPYVWIILIFRGVLSHNNSLTQCKHIFDGIIFTYGMV